GFRILDVSNPSSPTLLGMYKRTYGCVQVVDGLAYLGDLIIDVTDPTSPTKVSWCPVGFGVKDVYVSGGLGYYAAGGRGLYIADVSDPTSPTLFGPYGGWPGPLDEAVGV
ncbi:hypothetical protein AMJ85_02620, partial [candidate division BRC1 bacterium SM23_51]